MRHDQHYSLGVLLAGNGFGLYKRLFLMWMAIGFGKLGLMDMAMQDTTGAGNRMADIFLPISLCVMQFLKD
jgi:hypothetical protein